MVQHQDLVGVLDGREPVRDDEARPAPHRLRGRRLDLLLRLGVHRRRGLVQHQDGRVHRQRPREGEELPLPDREVLAALAEPVREPGRQPLHDPQRRPPAAPPPPPPRRRPPRPRRDVAPQVAGEQEDLLLHQPDEPPQLGLRQLPDVHAVHGDAAAVHVVVAQQQADDRGLARPGVPDDRQRPPRPRRERHAPQHPAVVAALAGRRAAARVPPGAPRRAPRAGSGTRRPRTPPSPRTGRGSAPGPRRVPHRLRLVEQGEDPFRRRHRRLQDVELLRQVLEGAEEPPHQLQERREHADRHGVVEHPRAAVHEHARDGDGGQQLHHREEDGVDGDRLEVRVEVRPVDAVEGRRRPRLPAEQLHHPHPRQVLLQVAVDAGDPDPDVAVRLRGPAAGRRSPRRRCSGTTANDARASRQSAASIHAAMIPRVKTSPNRATTPDVNSSLSDSTSVVTRVISRPTGFRS